MLKSRILRANVYRRPTLWFSKCELYRAFISVINQLDAQNFCFTISLLHASTCFEHMCSSLPIGVMIPEAV